MTDPSNGNPATQEPGDSNSNNASDGSLPGALNTSPPTEDVSQYHVWTDIDPATADLTHDSNGGHNDLSHNPTAEAWYTAADKWRAAINKLDDVNQRFAKLLMQLQDSFQGATADVLQDSARQLLTQSEAVLETLQDGQYVLNVGNIGHAIQAFSNNWWNAVDNVHQQEAKDEKSAVKADIDNIGLLLSGHLQKQVKQDIQNAYQKDEQQVLMPQLRHLLQNLCGQFGNYGQNLQQLQIVSPAQSADYGGQDPYVQESGGYGGAGAAYGAGGYGNENGSAGYAGDGGSGSYDWGGTSAAMNPNATGPEDPSATSSDPYASYGNDGSSGTGDPYGALQSGIPGSAGQTSSGGPTDSSGTPGGPTQGAMDPAGDPLTTSGDPSGATIPDVGALTDGSPGATGGDSGGATDPSSAPSDLSGLTTPGTAGSTTGTGGATDLSTPATTSGDPSAATTPNTGGASGSGVTATPAGPIPSTSNSNPSQQQQQQQQQQQAQQQAAQARQAALQAADNAIQGLEGGGSDGLTGSSTAGNPGPTPSAGTGGSTGGGGATGGGSVPSTTSSGPSAPVGSGGGGGVTGGGTVPATASSGPSGGTTGGSSADPAATKEAQAQQQAAQARQAALQAADNAIQGLEGSGSGSDGLTGSPTTGDVGTMGDPTSGTVDPISDPNTFGSADPGGSTGTDSASPLSDFLSGSGAQSFDPQALHQAESDVNHAIENLPGFNGNDATAAALHQAEQAADKAVEAVPGYSGSSAGSTVPIPATADLTGIGGDGAPSVGGAVTPDAGGVGAGPSPVQTLDTNVASQEGFGAPTGSGGTPLAEQTTAMAPSGGMSGQAEMPMSPMGMGGMGGMGGMANSNKEREPQTWLQAPDGTWHNEDAEAAPPSVVGRS
ncbi:MAG TPA: hypothetical protein VFG87_17730 [Amycolatopsis sp.]|nr:hypothetical protein [Amycolatopsis sp.]